VAGRAGERWGREGCVVVAVVVVVVVVGGGLVCQHRNGAMDMGWAERAG
jgi:hypothetical protein